MTPTSTLTDVPALWAAVDRLTQPHTQKLERDNGQTETFALPSLFDQLAEAVHSLTSQGNNGRQQSRPPLDLNCLSLHTEITTTIRNALHQHHRKPLESLNLDLRSLVSELIRTKNPEPIQQWTEQARTWAGQIRTAISSDSDRAWRLWGFPCFECRATHTQERQPDSTYIRVPAIRVIWSNKLVRGIECAACGMTIMRSGLLDRIPYHLTAGVSHVA